MVEIKKEFIHQPPEARLKVVGISVVSIGDREGDYYDTDLDESTGSYRKIFYSDREQQKIKGLISIGDFEDNNKLIAEVKTH